MQVTQYSQTEFEIFTIDGAFSDAEIDALSSFVDSRILIASDKNFTGSGFSNGKLLHPVLAARILSRVTALLPETYVDACGVAWMFVDASRHVFYASMSTGDMFGIHTDTGSEYKDELNNRTLSRHTVIIYLNDGFQGGRTTFYSDAFEKTCEIIPQKGRLLAFDIDRYHKGERVLNGTKKWFGIELVARSVHLS